MTATLFKIDSLAPGTTAADFAKALGVPVLTGAAAEPQAGDTLSIPHAKYAVDSRDGDRLLCSALYELKTGGWEPDYITMTVDQWRVKAALPGAEVRR
jgi:hypothetical protein